MSNRPWIGYDLDGTLVKHDPETFSHHTVGALIEGPLLDQFRSDIHDMIEDPNAPEVKIMTARVRGLTSRHLHEVLEAVHAAQLIQAWSKTYFGVSLDVTACKDYNMIRLYDDRAIQVITNTGEIVHYRPMLAGDAVTTAGYGPGTT